MANRLFPILLGIALFQAFDSSPCRASFSPVVQAAITGKSALSDDTSRQTRQSGKPARLGSTNVDSELGTANDLQNSLQITSLPPVGMQDKRKTIKDYLLEWGPWVFSLLLVIVGALQVFLLQQTLLQMARQSAYDREGKRAKLVVLFPPDRPEFNSGDAAGFVPLKDLAVRFKNYGYTDAFTVVAKGAVLVGNDKGENATQKLLAKWERIAALSASDTAQITDTVPFYFTTSIPSQDYDKLLEGLTHLLLVGSVQFEDIYGDLHESPFSFLWTFKNPMERGVRVDKSEWFDQLATNIADSA